MAEAIQWLNDKNKIIGKVQFVIINNIQHNRKTSKLFHSVLLVFFYEI